MKGRSFLLIPLLIIALFAVPAGRLAWHYNGLPAERSIGTPNLLGLTVPTPPAGEYIDVPPVGRGLVLVDRAHGNLFTQKTTMASRPFTTPPSSSTPWLRPLG